MLFLSIVVSRHEEIDELIDHATWAIPCVLGYAYVIPPWLLMVRLWAISHQRSGLFMRCCRLNFVVVFICCIGRHLIAIPSVAKRIGQNFCTLTIKLISCFVDDIWWAWLLWVFVFERSLVGSISYSIGLPTCPRRAHLARAPVIAIDAYCLPNMWAHATTSDLYAHALAHLLLSNERLI